MANTFCSGIPRMKLAVESCCEAHDRAYTKGSLGTRREADWQLWACLATQRPIFAYAVWVGTRLFGWIFYKRA
jgi:hypothetical protein